MTFLGIVLYQKNTTKEDVMRLTEKISWLMGRVQKKLVPLILTNA